MGILGSLGAGDGAVKGNRPRGFALSGGRCGSGSWGLLGRLVSEYGRLCHGAGGPRTGRASPEGANVAYAPADAVVPAPRGVIRA